MTYESKFARKIIIKTNVNRKSRYKNTNFTKEKKKGNVNKQINL